MQSSVRHAALLFLLLFSLAAHFPAASPSAAFPDFLSLFLSLGKISLRGVPKAYRVTHFLYRGARLSFADLSELKMLGSTTLAVLHAGSTNTSTLERAKAKSLGFRFLHLPVGGFSTPSSARARRFFPLLRAALQTVFVQCEIGREHSHHLHWPAKACRFLLFRPVVICS